MAGEPKSISKILTTTLATILESSSSDSEHVTLNHIRVTAGAQDTQITAAIADSSLGITANIWNQKLLKAYTSEDIYVQALEPGDIFKVKAEPAGASLVVQYESNVFSGGAFSLWPASQQFALALTGYVTDNYDKTDSSEKYEFATDLSRAWISLGTTRQSGTGFGDGTKAYLVAGNIDGYSKTLTADVPSRKHTFVTLVNTSTTALGLNRLYSSSFYNQTTAYTMGGGNATYSTSGGTTDTRQWDMTTDTVAISGLLGTARTMATAASNSVKGIYGGGCITTSGTTTETTEKFEFTSQAWLPGTSLTSVTRSLNATSTSDRALFVGGYNDIVGSAGLFVTNSYVFVTDVCTATTSLPREVVLGQATSNADFALFLGGEPSSSNINNLVSKFAWATDTWTVGTNLEITRGYGVGVSSSPGHF